MPRRKTPLREQKFLIGSIAVGALIGIGIFLVPRLLDGGGPALPPVLVIGIVVVTLVILAGSLALGLGIGRRIVGDRIEVAMREPGGRWRHGRLTVAPGHLVFQPYLLQVRIPRGSPVEIDVERLGDDTGNRPSLRQIMSLNPQVHIVDVASPQGDRQIAALPSHLEELRERLAGERQVETP